MTAVEPHIRDFELPHFAFSQKKAKNHANGGSHDFHFTPFHKSHDMAHFQVHSNRQFNQFSHSHKHNQFQSSHPISNKPTRYHNNKHGNNHYEMNYNFEKFSKENIKTSSDKSWIAYASTASSESDTHVSELNGFRIVQNGKIVHDEIEEDFDSAAQLRISHQANHNGEEKFAASTMMIGPKEISLPSFA